MPEFYDVPEDVREKIQRCQAAGGTKLDLSSAGLDEDNIAVVVQAIAKFLPKLTTLNLKYNNISDADAESLSSLTKLTTLHWGNNKIGDPGASSLSALTRKYPDIPHYLKRWVFTYIVDREIAIIFSVSCGSCVYA